MPKKFLNKFTNFFQKTLDKQPRVCYNKDTKEREVIKMAKSKNDVMYYMSKMTGEVVETHAEAMELYRAGHDIACYGWSEHLQEVVNKLDWEH